MKKNETYTFCASLAERSANSRNSYMKNFCWSIKVKQVTTSLAEHTKKCLKKRKFIKMLKPWLQNDDERKLAARLETAYNFLASSTANEMCFFKSFYRIFPLSFSQFNIFLCCRIDAETTFIWYILIGMFRHRLACFLRYLIRNRILQHYFKRFHRLRRCFELFRFLVFILDPILFRKIEQQALPTFYILTPASSLHTLRSLLVSHKETVNVLLSVFLAHMSWAPDLFSTWNFEMRYANSMRCTFTYFSWVR